MEREGCGWITSHIIDKRCECAEQKRHREGESSQSVHLLLSFPPAILEGAAVRELRKEWTLLANGNDSGFRCQAEEIGDWALGIGD
jgi:hypothetical protein